MKSLPRSRADKTGVNCSCFLGPRFEFANFESMEDVRKEVRADMFWCWSLVLLAATLCLPRSSGQMRGVYAGLGHGGVGKIGRAHSSHPSHRVPRELFPGSSYLYPDVSGGYYSDEQYDQRFAEEGASPQVVIMQPAAADNSPRKIKPDPLLIELQGDHYVRFGGADETDGIGTSAHPDYAESTTAKPIREVPAAQKERTEAPSTETTSVILVYRDGHREEIPDYAIANGMIYAHGTSWRNGYWTKQIALSALDSAATLRANQERGVKFMLPSAPNVVIASF
jgi:hypothetical protein